MGTSGHLGIVGSVVVVVGKVVVVVVGMVIVVVVVIGTGTMALPSARYTAGGSANAVDHARQQVSTKKTAGRAEKMKLDIYTYDTTLFGEVIQVNARNVPVSLGDPGRDVTDPFRRGMEPTW